VGVVGREATTVFANAAMWRNKGCLLSVDYIFEGRDDITRGNIQRGTSSTTLTAADAEADI